MNQQDIKNTLAEHAQRITNVERALKPVQSGEKQSEIESAQEAHEAAQIAFQTQHLDGMNVSLNGAPVTETDIQELLRDETKQED